MTATMKELEQLIRKGEMRHAHNTCARWNFGNVRCAVDGNENIKPGQKEFGQLIDAFERELDRITDEWEWE